jgi:hypothetical protein
VRYVHHTPAGDVALLSAARRGDLVASEPDGGAEDRLQAW